MPSLPVLVASAFLRAAAIAVAALAAMPSRADCIDDAAARQRVNAQVLRAIGWQESRLRPEAIGHNANGSIDVGAFQINSIHWPTLARWGIAREALADGCVSADVAAWHYRRQVDTLGNTWAAVGAYHSGTPARAAWYANQVAAILTRWKVMAPGVLPYAGQPMRPPPTSSPSPRVGMLAAIAPAAAADSGVDMRTFSALAFLPSAR